MIKFSLKKHLKNTLVLYIILLMFFWLSKMDNLTFLQYNIVTVAFSVASNPLLTLLGWEYKQSPSQSSKQEGDGK